MSREKVAWAVALAALVAGIELGWRAGEDEAYTRGYQRALVDVFGKVTAQP